MKSYDEFAEKVFREADQRLASRKKRAALIRRYTFALASMFAIVLTGIFVFKNETAREALEKKFNDDDIITIEPDPTTVPPVITTDSSGAEIIITTTDNEAPRETTAQTTVSAEIPEPETTASETESTGDIEISASTTASAVHTSGQPPDTRTTTARTTGTETENTTTATSAKSTATTSRRTTRTTSKTQGVATTTKRTTTTASKPDITVTTTKRTTTTTVETQITIATTIISLFAKAKNITHRQQKKRESYGILLPHDSPFCFIASFAFVLQMHRAKPIPLKMHERVLRLPPGGSSRRSRVRESALQ